MIEAYLNTRDRIIRPVLDEICQKLKGNDLNAETVVPEINRDLLDEKIAEYGTLDNFGTISLIGQIALSITYDDGSEDMVIIGFDESTKLVFVINPRDRNFLKSGLDRIEKHNLEKWVMKKLSYIL